MMNRELRFEESPSKGSFRQHLCAWQIKYNHKYERLMESRKRALFANVQGRILEIGPGTGSNLKFFPRGIHWMGIEPNPFMDSYLQRESRRLGLAIEIRRGTAEKMDVEDESADVAVSTLVLCSVPDVTSTLREVSRALKPGGKFVFVEHVAAPRGTWHRRIQRMSRPVVRCLADNCHPDRETWASIEG